MKRRGGRAVDTSRPLSARLVHRLHTMTTVIFPSISRQQLALPSTLPAVLQINYSGNERYKTRALDKVSLNKSEFKTQ